VAAEQTIAPGNRIAIRWRWQWLLLVFPALMVLGVVAFATLKPVKVLPRVRPAPSFILTDQIGRRLTNEDLRGQTVLYTFGYSGCDATCEPLNAMMKSVQDDPARYTADDLPLTLVTMLFDPERDTPEAMQAYAKSVGADPARWHFATGDPTRLKQTIGGGFEVYYTPKNDGGFTFEPAAVLVDALGMIRGEYRMQAQNLDTKVIMRQLDVLAREMRNSTGANRLAYEAAHLFLCYAH
jgi:protein SCO1/2